MGIGNSATMGVPSSGDTINVGWITRVYVPCFLLRNKTKFLTNTFWLFLFVLSIAIILLAGYVTLMGNGD